MSDHEFDMEREEAERYPCPYVVPTSQRSKAEPRRCGADVGEMCRNPLTGQPVRHITAHLPRLRAAGVAASSTVGQRAQPNSGPVHRQAAPDHA